MGDKTDEEKYSMSFNVMFFSLVVVGSFDQECFRDLMGNARFMKCKKEWPYQDIRENMPS